MQRVNDISWQTVVKKEPKNIVAVMSGSLKSYFYLSDFWCSFESFEAAA